MTSEQSALLEMYKEHASQARQHETQRERMSAGVVAVGVALTAFIAQGMKEPTIYLLFPAAFMVVLGIFGALFARKHYERNRLHTAIMARYQDALEATLVATPLQQIRNGARTQHDQLFPGVSKWRLYRFWEWLNVMIALTGILLGIVIILTVLTKTGQLSWLNNWFSEGSH
jgi:hypothetical protein